MCHHVSRNPPEKPSDSTEIAGEATEEACALWRSPKRRRSNIQASKNTNGHARQNGACTATRCNTDGGVEPDHDGEPPGEAYTGRRTQPPLIYYPKQKNPSTTHSSAAAIHRIDVND